ncbi:hypothetical protein MSG28_009586 [Choristoneura fumiferana]|uniref:Uncharacterized protein n=1 Tax=Choristoneura fumiferana TaxID=7141 RepID=A0ACC0JBN6_CHOFU|nr:hypothetical protein MSG28_009586 [Choristoneura fumiferana]
MTSLINKIELLIKREKTTPERKKKEEASKSSSEILSELFSAFNADPPKIDEASLKKSKKSKKKHKKEKKKRSRSSSSSDSDDSDYSHKRKKRKKSKSKKKRERSRSGTPSKIKADLETIRVKNETGRVKSEDIKVEIKPKIEAKEVPHQRVSIKVEDPLNYGVDVNNIDASLIPMPDSPKQETDLRHKLDSKKQEVDNDKSKSKIQIKNLKFSAVFEETVKKAEEEARKKAEKYEEGEYTDSSTSSEKPEVPNAEFPKSSDPGGILKKQAAVEIYKQITALSLDVTSAQALRITLASLRIPFPALQPDAAAGTDAPPQPQPLPAPTEARVAAP